MLSLLIVILFSQLFFLFLSNTGFLNIRQSFIKATVALAAFITFSTETLSFFTALNSKFVAPWWFAGNIVLASYLFYRNRGFTISIFPTIKQMFQTKVDCISSFTHKFYISMLIGIYSTVLFIGLCSPPNTQDSITYHLARVANWIQAGSVEFYPAATLRQFYQSPFAEYVILHLQLLEGFDHFANLVQFFCFAACGVTASLIVQKFQQSV